LCHLCALAEELDSRWYQCIVGGKWQHIIGVFGADLE
jgi:hypothetical protein